MSGPRFEAGTSVSITPAVMQHQGAALSCLGRALNVAFAACAVGGYNKTYFTAPPLRSQSQSPSQSEPATALLETRLTTVDRMSGIWLSKKSYSLGLGGPRHIASSLHGHSSAHIFFHCTRFRPNTLGRCLCPCRCLSRCRSRCRSRSRSRFFEAAQSLNNLAFSSPSRAPKPSGPTSRPIRLRS